ncbi:hypothetical protein V9T40_006977 [Parthenolecanium corni]|uniref:Uncharacterized protein n=1 Tax=Parthenolecanium corni TaxID=536013 RepID=A0AAN9YB80_9HEMI
MYVIFPAEDVVELTLTRPPLQRSQHCSCQCAALQKRVSAQTYSSPTPVKRLQTPGQPSLNASVSKSNAAAAPSPPPPLKPRSKKKDCKTTNSKSNKKEKQERSNPKMGTNVNEPSLKDLSHPSLNEQLKAYNTATFKLVKTGKVF